MPSGKKLLAWKKIMVGLRASVADTTEQPKLKSLKVLQETFLLSPEKMARYVVNRSPLGNLDPQSASLVTFILGKVRNKPQKYTAEQLDTIQRLCLLTDEQIWSNIIRWWIRRH